MDAIWRLSRAQNADTAMLLYAYDAHFPALLAAADSSTTIQSLYGAGLQPGVARVYSVFETSEKVEKLAAQTTHTACVIPRVPKVSRSTTLTNEEKLFAQASSNCRSVRYIGERFLACTNSPEAQTVAGMFLLGAYLHANSAEPQMRKQVYAAKSTVALLLGLKLTSRELHEALVEFTTALRTKKVTKPAPEWARARRRAWGEPLGPCRSRSPRTAVLPVSPLARIVAVAAPSQKWTINREHQRQVTASMHGHRPPTLLRAIRDAERAFKCEGELESLATSTSKRKLSFNGVLAASAVVRRLALTVTALSLPVAQAQRQTLRRAKQCSTLKLTVCTNCCTLCAAPEGHCPSVAGLRLDLAAGSMTCVRCEQDDGLVTLDCVGKILTFATPTMILISVVVCGLCGTITTLSADTTWGELPLCTACFKKKTASVREPKLCWCGQAITGLDWTWLGAVDDAGRDVEMACCHKHAALGHTLHRPRVSDLCLLTK